MSVASFLPLSLTAMSARTAVGDDIEETCASVRAGIVRLREHPTYRSIAPDGPGEPLVTGRVDGVDPGCKGRERLLGLLVPVLEDVMRRGDVSPFDCARVALLVSLPVPEPVVDTWHIEETFVEEIQKRLALRFGQTHFTRSGHGGAIELFLEAQALLAIGAVDACIVAGVDSYLSLDRLEPLDAAYRLKSRRNVDAFVPGEAASALLFENAERMTHRNARVLARIMSVGVGDEPNTMAGDLSSSGTGLTGAMRAALGNESIGLVLSDFNGESYRGSELGIAGARVGKKLANAERWVFPVLSMGDIGAASGALLVGLAAEAFRRGHAPEGDALVSASGDGSRRAAARVRRPL